MKKYYLLLMLWSLVHTKSVAQVKGEDRTLGVIDHLIENLGGKELWRSAQGIEVELVGYYIGQKVPWVERFWLDYSQPRGKYLIKSSETDRQIAWDIDGGWELKDGGFERQSTEGHSIELAYYRAEPTVVFQRLAKEDSRLEVRLDTMGQSIKLSVFDTIDADLICTFHLNRNHEPIYWTANLGTRKFERVLGPLKEFSNGLKLFAWGASPTGSWRYEHRVVKLSNSVFPISYEPPKGYKE
ncbi:MAG: hypothetical protein RLN86_04475 [Cyclobacteriaceae bacterium]